MKKQSELSKFTHEELMIELKSRSNGFVLGIELKGKKKEFITAFSPENILNTIGVHRILKERIDIYLQDTTREAQSEIGE